MFQETPNPWLHVQLEVQEPPVCLASKVKTLTTVTNRHTKSYLYCHKCNQPVAAKFLSSPGGNNCHILTPSLMVISM